MTACKCYCIFKLGLESLTQLDDGLKKATAIIAAFVKDETVGLESPTQLEKSSTAIKLG